MPTLPNVSEPVVPLGTHVRARPIGWGEEFDPEEAWDQTGPDDLPEYTPDWPEWLEGPLEGRAIGGAHPYFQHTVQGAIVEPSSVEPVTEGAGE